MPKMMFGLKMRMLKSAHASRFFSLDKNMLRIFEPARIRKK